MASPSMLFIDPERPLEAPLAPASEQVTHAIWSRYYDHIWEPSHREVFDKELYKKAIALDKQPLPAGPDREFYFGDRHVEYWVSGLADYEFLLKAYARNGIPRPEKASYMDFGCASGRVLRHYRTLEPSWTLYGADLNANNIAWLNRYLGDRVQGFVNTTVPHLPLADSSLDLVSAYSVFTHIDTLELTWLLELNRVLKPGGIAALTIMSDHLWREIDETHYVYDAIKSRSSVMRMPHPITEFTPDLFKNPMPAPRLPFNWGQNESHLTIIFHSHDYIRSVWGRIFDVIEITRRGHCSQDMVLLRKR